MKKTIMAVAILLFAGATASAQDSTKKSSGHKHHVSHTQQYTCSMHPEVVMDKPGKCPKCGMTLVKIKNKKTAKPMGEMKM